MLHWLLKQHTEPSASLGVGLVAVHVPPHSASPAVPRHGKAGISFKEGRCVLACKKQARSTQGASPRCHSGDDKAGTTAAVEGKRLAASPAVQGLHTLLAQWPPEHCVAQQQAVPSASKVVGVGFTQVLEAVHHTSVGSLGQRHVSEAALHTMSPLHSSAQPPSAQQVMPSSKLLAAVRQVLSSTQKAPVVVGGRGAAPNVAKVCASPAQCALPPPVTLPITTQTRGDHHPGIFAITHPSCSRTRRRCTSCRPCIGGRRSKRQSGPRCR